MELLAIVNSQGQFVKPFDGMFFETFKLKTNTNDIELNGRVAIFLSELALLHQQYDALVSECKAKTIEGLESAFKLFVAECRAKKKEVAEAIGTNVTWQQEKNRLSNVIANARAKLDVAMKSQPAIYEFPSDEEIDAWKQSVVKAENSVNDAVKNLRKYEQDYSFYAADVSRQQADLKSMIEQHDKMYIELQRAEGIVTEGNNSVLSEFGLMVG
jgi:hypothetical protein